MNFDCSYTMTDGEARVSMRGELDASAASQFKTMVEEIATQKPSRLVMMLQDVSFMASAGLRVLVFSKQKMGAGTEIYLVGCQPPVLSTLTMSGFHHSVYLKDRYPD
jgi:anti-sigma B factor antagonist